MEQSTLLVTKQTVSHDHNSHPLIEINLNRIDSDSVTLNYEKNGNFLIRNLFDQVARQHVGLEGACL